MSHDHFQRHRLILNMINHLGPISRTALIELTAYRPATVGALVGELLEQNLIEESGYRSSGQGRKRTLLQINARHICGIGLSFTQNDAAFLISQFDGTIVYQDRLSLPQEASRAELLQMIGFHIKNLLNQHSSLFIAGIGICMPLVDPVNYRRSDPSATGKDSFSRWISEKLAPQLRKALNIPVEVYSGVTLPAQAEHRFGVAKGVNDFIWVELSNGIGTSIFSGGTAVSGARGFAGELGHISVPSDGPQKLCYCGKPGCVEAEAGWPALLADIQAALKSGVISFLQSYPVAPEDLTVKDIRRALDAGDRMCTYYVRRAGRLLGTAISNSVNLLNPKLIVLYGFMLELGDTFLDALQLAMREGTVFSSGDYQVLISTSSESIMPLGAVANIFSSYLQADDYRWVYQLDRRKYL